jgi:hypothetical protein
MSAPIWRESAVIKTIEIEIVENNRKKSITDISTKIIDIYPRLPFITIWLKGKKARKKGMGRKGNRKSASGRNGTRKKEAETMANRENGTRKISIGNKGSRKKRQIGLITRVRTVRYSLHCGYAVVIMICSFITG